MVSPTKSPMKASRMDAASPSVEMLSTSGQDRHELPSRVLVNKNTNWLSGPAVWTWYVGLIIASWLIFSAFVEPGMAWTYTHLLHSVLTYFMFHWQKGSPIQDDQGKYDYLTFWEQLDDGVQYTRTRKFLTVVPVLLFLLATHGADFRRQPLGLNLLAVIVLLVAKAPTMHKVRIWGINKY